MKRTYKSFIDKAKHEGSNSLLGKFYINSDNRFDDKLKDLVIDKFDSSGKVECSLIVNKPLLNSYGFLHGGAASLIIDVVGTLSFLAKDSKKAGVSLDMNSSFLNPAKEFDELLIKGNALKVGRKVGFSEIGIYDKITNKLLVTGRHTKYFI